ncbi:hypothetical protein PILCRDRAFT_748124 [Piloderma croceum F 1598]|uniref:Uncharacterized protein n=1 Tax=Piloderma croceum (strain F 1598) TaxID=765440 RepID=A0A0C3EV46_PILCF|nr:hypothetical protein PILCRDRAFT_748124 [Piloderma croceum F 1598]
MSLIRVAWSLELQGRVEWWGDGLVEFQRVTGWKWRMRCRGLWLDRSPVTYTGCVFSRYLHTNLASHVYEQTHDADGRPSPACGS